ncbi:helix-turn-helix protein [Paractinoplanes brasiliensis]|uniref:Helix-turn-helix protein n=1 Tax=Paractinoplanes brasiliensis TaxID=52695 RepID=A0A4R6JD41_9ACTN|nr:helix-turn-helix protein [Actinoplanes brasiliensis]GID31574.1 hypothetical protein Abr02nite_65570 [Actinoplanes brasiliensis]
MQAVACATGRKHPAGAVTGVAARLGVDPVDFRFDAMDPISAAANRRWAATVTYLTRLLSAPGEADLHPLMLTAALETAATAAVTVFPNSTMTLDYVADPGQVTPAAIRRAVAYADANAASPLTPQNIADAAGVGVRALQTGFRRHVGTTPMGYLRRVRLERAHRDLQAADPHQRRHGGRHRVPLGLRQPGAFRRPLPLGVRPPSQPNPAHVKHRPSWTVSGAPRAGRR